MHRMVTIVSDTVLHTGNLQRCSFSDALTKHTKMVTVLGDGYALIVVIISLRMCIPNIMLYTLNVYNLY